MLINNEEKLYIAESLRELADKIEESDNNDIKFICIQLHEIWDKLDCWNTGREYIDPLN